jgi:hypothetical protein
MFNINLSNDKKILKKLIFLKILLKYRSATTGPKTHNHFNITKN